MVRLIIPRVRSALPTTVETCMATANETKNILKQYGIEASRIGHWRLHSYMKQRNAMLTIFHS